MAWETLRTDYVDAVFDGLRKYQMIANQDNTYSFADVTVYAVKEGAFIGAKDINAMNVAMNLIMAALNNGTNLYDVFTQFFENQKVLFEETADNYNDDFEEYLANLRKSVMEQCTQLETDYTEEITQFISNQETAFNDWYDSVKEQCAQLQTDYVNEITQFEQVQETAFNTWFSFIKNQLTEDAAGHLQEEILKLTSQLGDAEKDIEGLSNRLTDVENDNEELREMLISGHVHACMSDSDGDILCAADGSELEAQWILATV